MTTLSLVAHPDDDLLFLNPDIASDLPSGAETWVVYLTAGNLSPGPGGEPYADQRINGLRAAYARAAKVPANQAVWDFQLITLPSGRQLASNQLRQAPHVRLVWTYINAANGADNGDLYRMWADPAFVAHPIDTRPSYTKAQFIAMLKELVEHLQPEFLRITDPSGQEIGDHIDHAYAGKFAATANLDIDGQCVRRMDAYFGYAAANFPPNSAGYWFDEKLAIWRAYKPFDPAFAVGSTAWDGMASRQMRRHVWMPGDTWLDL
jgi:LmbE family N-acetylglucosaminyl deacetylase